jgi:hypothetical protein
MSNGAIGKGISYFATIKISGDLDAAGLKKLVADIENLIQPHNGKIEKEARASTAATFDASFSPQQRP